jgi:YVTN family beta-propeller protein
MKPQRLQVALVVLAGSLACACRAEPETVGISAHDPDRLVTPVNQVVDPHGTVIQLPGMRPQAIALSPDGELLVTAGKTHELVVLDPRDGALRQRVPLPSEESTEPLPPTVSDNILAPDESGQLSYTGLVFSPDGRRIVLSNVNGSLKVFAVAADGVVSPSHSIALPAANAPWRAEEIPAGLAFGPRGERLLVCGNLSNRLLELDAASGAVLRSFDVGVAPYDVAVVAGKAYVSNWGGRRPGPGDLTGPAGRGTEVRVDPVRHVASEGSVTVIDLASGTATGEILVRLHSSALTVAPDGRYLVCANAGSDNLSVIDTVADEVVETVWVKPSPSDLFGAQPTALAFDSEGERLYVANGTHNAVAVVDFEPGESELLGMIPAGWFPGAIAFDERRGQLCVANIKGHGPGRPRESDGRAEFNSHQYHGSVVLMPLPAEGELEQLSAAVEANYRRERIEQALLPPRPDQPPRPVPERIGEPSVIEHVVYVIKENRTYDQVLGDLARGDGDPDLCVFGEEVTPNQHALAREFVLLDNTYCAGILSADGHQWSTSAIGTDYLERSFAGWPRSYPDGMLPEDVDALAYSPQGFLWDNAVSHGRTLHNFGEFCIPECGWSDPTRAGAPTWSDYYREFLEGGGEVSIGCRPGIESIRPFSPTDTVGWIMAVPDVWRARYVVEQIAAWEREGDFPDLVLICLPNDHTSGTSAGSPTPAACVADNDLAFGRIVEALSHSRFWPRMAIFGIEDDPQAGWDHVSGYRTTAYVVSPWARRGAVVSTLYNTTSVLRTIEQILGLPPMNQFDASATPMSDCFTSTPDYTPFSALPNRVPLDQMNPEPAALTDPVLRRDAVASAGIDWTGVDRAPEDLLNRILWRAMKGSQAPYPEWAVTAVEDDD